MSYLSDREVPGVCPAVNHHRQFTTEALFSRVRSCAAFHLQLCTFRKLSLASISSATHYRHAIQTKMKKNDAESDSKREFNEQWENELFIAVQSGKPLCSVCKNTFSQNRRHDLNRQCKTQHQTEIEGKLKLVLGLRKEYVTTKKEEIRRQNVSTKRSCESLTIREASYEIAFALAKKLNLYLTGKKLLSLISRYLHEV